jgi:hypothetical protein
MPSVRRRGFDAIHVRPPSVRFGSGDEGSSDLIVNEVIRRNELQVWFVAEHVVPLPLAQAK